MDYEKKLRRFVYTGQCTLKYTVGDDFINTTSDELKEMFIKVTETIELAESSLGVVRVAKTNSSLSYPIYAFAGIIKHIPKDIGFDDVRTLACSIVPIVITTSKELMLFNKYAKDFDIKKGSFWQTIMTVWYEACDFKKITHDCCAFKSAYGWKHKDIHNLLHAPNISEPHGLFCKYIFNGTDGFSGLESIPKNVVSEIRIVDKLKNCKDFNKAAEIIKNNDFVQFQNIPPAMLFDNKNSAKVWNAIIDRASIDEVLASVENLQNICSVNYDGAGRKVLQNYKSISLDIVKKLSNATASPITAFIKYCNLKKTKLMNNKHKKKDNDNKKNVKRSKPEEDLKENERIMSVSNLLMGSLMSLMERSLLAIDVLINARCLITLDMGDHMFQVSRPKKKMKPNEGDAPEEGIDEVADFPETTRKTAKCFYNKNVSPGDAGVVLAMHLLKLINKTTISIYSHKSIQCIEFDAKVIPSLEDAERKLRAANTGLISLNKPFDWAVTNKKKYDLFITITDTPSRARKNLGIVRKTSTDLKGALSHYQMTMAMPKAKAVTIALSSSKSVTATADSVDILDIGGFDERIPEMINNFFLETLC